MCPNRWEAICSSERERSSVQSPVLPVFLNVGRTQSLHAVTRYRRPPREELVNAKSIPLAGLLDCQQSAMDGTDNFGLSPDNPSLRTWRWQIGYGQGGTIWPHNEPAIGRVQV